MEEILQDDKTLSQSDKTLSQSDKTLSQQDLYLLKELNSKSIIAALNAEKALLESRISEQEYTIGVLNMYVKYGLTQSMRIDQVTGKIATQETKKEEEE